MNMKIYDPYLSVDEVLQMPVEEQENWLRFWVEVGHNLGWVEKTYKPAKNDKERKRQIEIVHALNHGEQFDGFKFSPDELYTVEKIPENVYR